MLERAARLLAQQQPGPSGHLIARLSLHKFLAAAELNALVVVLPGTRAPPRSAGAPA